MKRIAAVLCTLVLGFWPSGGCDGGMDGAGGFACLGPPTLSLDQDVYVQRLWQDEHVSYVVFNQRDDDALLSYRWQECTRKRGCRIVIERWEVPAGSARRFDADALIVQQSQQRLTFADGTLLGWLSPPTMPRVSPSLPIVSNTDLNGWWSGGQIETDLVEAPSEPFTLQVIAQRPAQTWHPEQDNPRPMLVRLGGSGGPDGMAWLDVLDVRSPMGTVRRDGADFIVELPGSMLTQEPLRLEVDVVVPDAARDGLLVGFQARICSEGSSDDCRSGSGELTRLFPLRAIE